MATQKVVTATTIVAQAYGPEEEAAFAALQKWCRFHHVSPNQFVNIIISKAMFCLRNYTTADRDGNPVVEMNLGKITLQTRKNARRRKQYIKRQGWDCAF